MIVTTRLLWLPHCSRVFGFTTRTAHGPAFSVIRARLLTTDCANFENLGLSKATAQRLTKVFNISEPTAMQRQLLPAIMTGKDVLLKDTTGTGKSFAIATALVDIREPALYVVPNRELALQISGWVEKLTPEAPAQLLIAGEEHQTHHPSSHLTIGTASNIWSLVQNGQWENKRWKAVVVDEADQAFRLPGRYAHWKKRWNRKAHPKPAEQVLETIMTSQTGKPQVIVSSATMNRPLRHWLLEKQWIKDAVYINGLSPPSAGVQHHCLIVSSDQVRNIQTQVDDEVVVGDVATDQDIDESMMECLETLCSIEPVKQGIIFVANDGSFGQVMSKLHDCDIDAIPLYESIAHGTQAQFYVATAMTGRGIDLPNISHVFIVGLSKSIDDYMHMAGRLGRLGQATGTTKVITMAKDNKYVEAKINSMFKLMNTPISMYAQVQ